ncbi:MAG TPA: hypothetical protein PKH07_19490, partial [bacterium]|nr:hypothetical protein [bacterium]
SVGIFRIQPVSIFMMDYYGQFHYDKVGYQPNVPLNFGWDIARSVKVDPGQSNGYYVVDAFGGLYAFGLPNLGSLYFSQDGVKDIEIVEGGGYYILNGYGLVDCVGGAKFYGDPPFTGQDRYLDLEPTVTGRGYYVLDVAGGIHTFGDATPFAAPLMQQGATAVDIELTPDGTGMYLLDSRGAVHALGTAEYHGEVYMGLDVARDLLVTSEGEGYVVLDAYGSTYRFGVAPMVQLVTEELVPPAAKDLEFGRGYIAPDRRVIARLDSQYAQPDVSADYVVWSANNGAQGKDLFLYDIVLDATRLLVSATKDQLNPAINGDKVVYTTIQTGRKEIYGVTIPSGTQEAVPFVIATSGVQQEQPDISADYVVWSAYGGVLANRSFGGAQVSRT